MLVISKFAGDPYGTRTRVFAVREPFWLILYTPGRVWMLDKAYRIWYIFFARPTTSGAVYS
jgi:hypothetical protein